MIRVGPRPERCIMTKKQTALQMTRHEVQKLHRNICANISGAEKSSLTDAKAAQAVATTLGDKKKT